MFFYLCVVCYLNSIQALPNFIFILTDDQDLTLGSMNYMPKTTKLIANEGKTFSNFFVNSPICCPSRSSILTGKYPHNVKVFNNSITGGCSSSDWQLKQEGATIASILKNEMNYKTFYSGKYLNQYGDKSTGGAGHVPPGYDWWLGLLGNSKYYNYTLSINGTRKFFSNSYLTDLITTYSLDFLNQIQRNHFFMMLATPACHAPFTPAPRHANLFPHLQTIKTAPFNATPENKHWIVTMPPNKLPQNVANLDEIYRNRIRTLQAVDEMVEALISKLKDLEILDQTYVIFASDNGFHIGQFTQPWDKRQPYESDIRVPLIIRGPNVPVKSLSEYPVSGIDLLPTILDLAGIKANADGVSFKKQLLEGATRYKKYILIEYWGEWDSQTVDQRCPWSVQDHLSECVPEAWCKCQDSQNNTYRCFLDYSNLSKLKFCAFEGGCYEMYNLIEDPIELNNLHLPRGEVQAYLNILEVLKQCQGANCEF